IVSCYLGYFGLSICLWNSVTGGFIGSPSNFFLSGIGLDDLSGTIPTLLFVMFQLAFAGLTAALISGGVVGRMKQKLG
ncbi:Ammonium transporter, partial [human gut metagenome]